MKKSLLFILMALTAISAVEAKVVISEDFSLFTSGTDQAPDMNNMMTDLTGLTQTPGWSAMYVCQAGGSAYLPAGANLITPPLDLSANNGSFVIKFRAKSDSSPAMVLMTDMYMTGMGYVEITSEWQDYSITLNNGSPNYMIAIQALYNDFYIDDIVVDDYGVDIPVALPSSNFTKDSFTANWEAAGGATSYLLDVFTYEYNYETTLFEPKYILQDKEVIGTSYEVTEGEFDVPYYYTVASKNDNIVSKESDRITVFPLPSEVASPTAFEANDIDVDMFTASWSASDIATKYYLQVLKIHTAQTAEDYVIIDTDFSEITSGTIEAPHKEMEYLFEGDWSAHMALMANGSIGINNQDIDFFGKGLLASPLITLAGEERVFTVNFKACSRDGMEKGVLQLHTVDALGNTTVHNSKEIALTEEWNDYSFELEGGAGEASIIAFTSDEAGMMYIDDLKVSVTMNANEVLPNPIRTYAVRGLSCDVTNLNATENDKICYVVTASWAVRQQEGVVIQIPEVKSEVSNVIYVNVPTSVANIKSEEKARVSVNGNTIMVAAPNTANVSIYTIDGKKVVSANNAPASSQYRIDNSGIYIVTVNDNAYKIVVK